MNINYITGVEVFSLKKELLDKETIYCIEDFLSSRNKKKYSSFSKGLRMTKFILKLMKVPDYEKRAELLLYIYYALRIFDDICDGDTLETLPLEKREKIIQSKEYGLYEILIKKARDIASQIGELDHINQSINNIEESLKFDFYRHIEGIFINSTELENNFYKMDIVGTILGTAVIFGLKSDDAVKKILWLGNASRKAMDIEDLEDDMKKNLFNIPIEDLEEFGITEDDITLLKERGIMSDNIKLWVSSIIKQINELLKKHKNMFSLKNLLMGNGVDLSFSTNYFRKLFNNLLLKYIIFPKGYISEIRQTVKSATNKIINCEKN